MWLFGRGFGVVEVDVSETLGKNMALGFLERPHDFSRQVGLIFCLRRPRYVGDVRRPVTLQEKSVCNCVPAGIDLHDGLPKK